MEPLRILKLCCVLMVIFQVSFAAADQSLKPALPAEELLFLTWPSYVDPEVIRDFEQRFNAKVREVYFETDDTRDKMLVETDGRGYDVVMVDEIQINAYRKRGWITPLEEKHIPNLRHIDPMWIKVRPAAANYGAPYAGGTTGIAYRADLVPQRITTWKQLFQPSEALRGKIVMIKNASDITGLALKALGYSVNSTDPPRLAQAEDLLQAQKPHVKSYSYPILDKDSDLVTGQVVAAIMYSGDPLQLKRYNANITYTIPEEGTILWIDYLTVLQSSPRKRLAMEFINFLNEPENAARIAHFIYCATPNKAAERLLPTEFLQNPDIYPGEVVLTKSEFSIELPSRVARWRNRIFARLLE